MMFVEHCSLLHVILCSLVEMHQHYRGTCCCPYWRISIYSLHTTVHVHKHPQCTRNNMIKVNILVQTDCLHLWSQISSDKPIKQHCGSFGPNPNLINIIISISVQWLLTQSPTNILHIYTTNSQTIWTHFMCTILVTGVNAGQEHQAALWTNKRTKKITSFRTSATAKRKNHDLHWLKKT